MNSIYKSNKREKNSIKILFLLSFYLYIVVTIINGNMYVAGLTFIWIPSLIFVLATLLVYKENCLNVNNVLVVLIALSATLSTAFSEVVPITSNSSWVNLIFCCFLYVLVTCVRLQPKEVRSIIRFHAGFALALCVIMLFNYVFSFSLSVYGRVSISYFGITKDVNYLSAFILPAFPYYLYLGCIEKKKKYIFYSGIIFLAAFLAGSRAAFISLLITVILVIFAIMREKNRKINKPLVLIWILLIGMAMYIFMINSSIFSRTMNFENYTSNSRLTIWKYALEGFYSHPVLGSGVTAGSYYSKMSTRWTTHNCFIDILTGQGIIGSILVIWLCARLLFKNKKNTIYMLCMFITCFAPMFFLNGYECSTFWLPMMLCSIVSKHCRDTDNIAEVILYGGNQHTLKTGHEQRSNRDTIRDRQGARAYENRNCNIPSC